MVSALMIPSPAQRFSERHEATVRQGMTCLNDQYGPEIFTDVMRSEKVERKKDLFFAIS